MMLGAVGLVQAWHEAGVAVQIPRLALSTAGLLVGSVPPDLAMRPLPALLDAASLLVPLFAGWIAAGVIWLFLRNPLRLRLIRARGDHMIISADGDLSRIAVAAEISAGRQVVAWQRSGAAGRLRETFAHAGATTDSLADAGLETARAVLLAGPDDRANLSGADAVIAAAEPARAPGDPLDLIVRIDDPDLRSADEARRDTALPPATRLRYVSLPDLAARSLFVFAPLDRYIRDGKGGRGVLAIGLTPAIERTLARLLIGDHPRQGGKVRITIVSADPVATEAGFRARNGRADALAPIRFVAAKLDCPDPAVLALADECLACLVDCGDDATTLAWGNALDDRFAAAGTPSPPIHLRLDRAPGALPPMLHAFGSLESHADPARLLQEGQDDLARAIHEFYLEGRLSEGEPIGTRASMREWEDLPERFRDDNRMVADCYRLKLRDIGARLVPGSGPPLRFSADELEELARAEHDRWMIAKLATGWTFGETRDDARKLHPDIVPYDSLGERIKELDREQIRIMTRLLGSSGQRAVRILTVAMLPGEHRWPRLEPLLAQLAVHYPDRLPLLAVAASDAPACAAIHRLAPGGWRVLVAGNCHVPAGGMAADLLARADTILALAADAAVRDILLARADLALVGPAAANPPSPYIRLTADGGIAQAPWSR